MKPSAADPDFPRPAPIAIVGMAGLFPDARDLEAFWANILACHDAAREAPEGRWPVPGADIFDPTPGHPDRLYGTRACYLEPFEPDLEGTGLDRSLLDALDPLCALALKVGIDAWRDGVTTGLDRRRTGVVLANIALPTDASSALTRELLGTAFAARVRETLPLPHAQVEDTLPAQAPAVHPLNRYVTGLPAGLLCRALGLEGGGYTLDAACASSLYALRLACLELQTGRLDAVLAGGMSRPQCLYTQVGFSQLRALSPSGRCSPFDARADGLVVGEGAGIFLLKRLSDAEAAGDRIYGVIRAVGLSNDVDGSLLAPASEGQLRAMRQAYQAAGWQPQDVDLIECHGTGTPRGDAVELASLRSLWGEAEGRCVLGSVKANVGHLLTGAGAAGLARVLLALRARTLPPNANYSHHSRARGLKSGPFQVLEAPEPWLERIPGRPRRAAVSAFGFGGINAHLLVEEYPGPGSAQPGGAQNSLTPADSRASIPPRFSSAPRTAGGESPRSASPVDVGGDQGSGRPRADRVESTGTGTVAPPAIAIVGMGAHFGRLDTLQAFQEAIFRGEPVRDLRPEHRWHGVELEPELAELPGAWIDALSIPVGRFRVPPSELSSILPQQLLMLEVAANAMEDVRAGQSEHDDHSTHAGSNEHSTHAGSNEHGTHAGSNEHSTHGLHKSADRLRSGIVVGMGLDLETTNFHLNWLLRQQAREWASQAGLELSHQAGAEWVERLSGALGPALDATRTLGALGGIIASRIARELRLGGPSFVLSGEEASGLRALEVAVRLLQAGEVDLMVAGAVDLAGDVRVVAATDLLRPWSRGGRARPFDERADGPMIGEGAAAVVLKRLDDALRDGDRIYSVVKGIGASHDRGADAHLSSDAYARALHLAWHEAGIAPSCAGYLEAHGSGAPNEDRIEAEALARVFGAVSSAAELEPSCALGSAAAVVGHTGAAGGMASVVKTALCLYQQVLPPLLDFARPVSGIDWGRTPFHMPHEPQHWLHDRLEGPRRAGVSSMSLEGSYLHAVLEAVESPQSARRPERARPNGDRGFGLFLVHGRDEAELQVGLARLRTFATQAEPSSSPTVLAEPGIETLAAAWYRSSPPPTQGGSAGGPSGERAPTGTAHPRSSGLTRAFVATDRHELLRNLELPHRPGRTMEGEVAFVFPGSGNHYLGMGRALALAFPEVPRALNEETGRLKSQLMPRWYAPWRHRWQPGWEGEAARDIAASPHRMIFGQVAHGILVSDVMRQFLGRPDAVIGYSLGESAGLFAARAWTDRDLMFTRTLESPLFRTWLAGPCEVARATWGIEEADWRVAVLNRPADQVRAALEGTASLLIVNAPRECVIGGRKHDVEALTARLGCEALWLEGVPTVHCSVVEPVAGHYRDLHLLPTVAPEGVRFYSGAWASSYTASEENAADSILANALYGFDFRATIERAWADGVRVFVEMGPQGSCSRMIHAILGHRPHMAVPACLRGRNPVRTVLRGLAKLAEAGIAVDLEPLYGPSGGISVDASKTSTKTSHSSIIVPVGGPMPLAPSSPFPPSPRAAGNVGMLQNGPDGVNILPELSEKPPQDINMSPPVGRGPFSPVTISPETHGTTLSPVTTSPETHGTTLSPLRVSPETHGTMLPPDAIPPETHGATLSPVVTSPAASWGTYGDAPAVRDAADGQSERLEPVRQALRHAGELTRHMLQSAGATADAHQAFLELSERSLAMQQQALAQQLRLAQLLSGMSLPDVPRLTDRQVGAEAERPFLLPSQVPPADPPAFDRDLCLELAIGSLSRVLGPMFAEVDSYPTRVRLPDEPLMLVDRIVLVEGDMGHPGPGRVVTEHDVHPGAWYLDANRVPVCISVEAGQADLFLSAYLGIDLLTKGERVYRLLDARVTFHRDLPVPGERIRYDIHIDRFIRQGDTWLFFFWFDGWIGHEHLITMRDGCAGFFSDRQLEQGRGIVTASSTTPPERRLMADGRPALPFTPLLPMVREAYDDDAVQALRTGDLERAFGPDFAGRTLPLVLRLPDGRMRLVHRILELDPQGGSYGLGSISGEADVTPDAWYLTCHFADDPVMPGTLMYECCLHTLRVFLLRMGWIGPAGVQPGASGAPTQLPGDIHYAPIPGISSRLRCRGQVTPRTQKVEYRIDIKELGYDPEPYVLADALMFVDGKKAIQIEDMSLRMAGMTRADAEGVWRTGTHPDSVEPLVWPLESVGPLQPDGSLEPVGPLEPDGQPEPGGPLEPVRLEPRLPALYDRERILAFAVGKPSEAFGEAYRVFDAGRRIARLPGPPFCFLDRITAAGPAPWVLKAGGFAEAQYDIPPDAWYFAANRQPTMPFAVILETALQPCGWLAAYLGSALRNAEDMHFRNLEGTATLHEELTPHTGTVTIRVKLTDVSEAGGMILQSYDMAMTAGGRTLYAGDTRFGFFPGRSLAQQVGVRGAEKRAWTPDRPGQVIELEREAPHRPEECGLLRTDTGTGEGLVLPAGALLMLDRIDCWLPDGGAAGLGFISGTRRVDPGEWFFAAHFYQDPVIPGSLGLEAFLQLLKTAMILRYGASMGRTHRFEAIAVGSPHRWAYRGQVIPSNQEVRVEASITAIEEGDSPMITASGFLRVDGRIIYEMTGFSLRAVPWR